MIKRLLPLLLICPCLLWAEDVCQIGELHKERPTLICQGFTWEFSGDDNGNAVATMRYRQVGSDSWLPGMPLYRLPGNSEQNNYGYARYKDPQGQKWHFNDPSFFAGSQIDLQPDTAYEFQLTVSDPDGVSGDAERLVQLRTRAEPMPFAEGEIRHVYPRDYQGEKQTPAYESIAHAVNGHQPWCDCYQLVHPGKAPPGTVIAVHTGIYQDDYNNYRSAVNWLHGTNTLVASGEAGKPIAIVAAGDGEVVLDAGGCDVFFDIRAADHLYFEGLTIRNTRIAFHGGLQGQQCATGLTVKNCRMENVQYGVLCQDGAAEDYYIADNVFIGRNPNNRFNPNAHGAGGRTDAGYAVNLAGQGHVVCHNEARNFWDGINVFANSLADPAYHQQSRSIDIYNNLISNCSDNFIETDGGYSNIRVLRNKCVNVGGAPLSVQPIYRGPVYFIGNIIWNGMRGKQFLKPDGHAQMLIIWHNTSSCFLDSMPNAKMYDIRNNLFMGPAELREGFTERRARTILSVKDHASAEHIVDHNAHRVGLDSPKPFTFGRREEYPNLEAFRSASGHALHSLAVQDYEIFADLSEPDHAYSRDDPLVDPSTVNVRLADDAIVIDAGAHIPGFNDDYQGDAPDLGAQEQGREAPVYGPR